MNNYYFNGQVEINSECFVSSSPIVIICERYYDDAAVSIKALTWFMVLFNRKNRFYTATVLAVFRYFLDVSIILTTWERELLQCTVQHAGITRKWCQRFV